MIITQVHEHTKAVSATWSKLEYRKTRQKVLFLSPFKCFHNANANASYSLVFFYVLFVFSSQKLFSPLRDNLSPSLPSP